MEEVMLTTVDNPYNPFKDWHSWLVFDHTMGYHTNERLASIAMTADVLTDEENLVIINDAMDELIKTGAINKQGEIVEYTKVYRSS